MGLIKCQFEECNHQVIESRAAMHEGKIVCDFHFNLLEDERMGKIFGSAWKKPSVHCGSRKAYYFK